VNKQAIIFGATGAVGRQLLNLCLNSDRYQKVTVIARRPATLSHVKLNWIEAELNTLDSLAPMSGLVNGDAFCCLGTTIKTAGSEAAFRKVDFDYVVKTARFAKTCAVLNFSMISAVGANAKSNNFYSRTKGEVEAAVIAEELPALRIFRPSLLKGKRDDFRPMEAFGNIASLLLTPLFLFGLRNYQPIGIEKLALAMYNTTTEGIDGAVRIYESSELQSY
jgi:uncharacterized protein YbjT (DUF2867 family)